MLAATIRERLIASIQQRTGRLKREKEQLDLSDSNAMLLHPNQYSIGNPASPGGPQAPRKTRRTGHKFGDAEELAAANEHKRKRKLFEDQGVGTAIKITRTEKGLWDGSSVLTFAYSYDKGTSIYYDLSSFSGFAFWGKKLRIHGPEGKAVEEVVWNGEPRPNRTLVFFGDTDLILELCD